MLFSNNNYMPTVNDDGDGSLPSVGHGGALIEAITLNRRVVGSTPALAAM